MGKIDKLSTVLSYIRRHWEAHKSVHVDFSARLVLDENIDRCHLAEFFSFGNIYLKPAVKPSEDLKPLLIMMSTMKIEVTYLIQIADQGRMMGRLYFL